MAENSCLLTLQCTNLIEVGTFVSEVEGNVEEVSNLLLFGLRNLAENGGEHRNFLSVFIRVLRKQEAFWLHVERTLY